MSDFVRFPEDVYRAAGNVFAAFDPTKSAFTPENALAMMWFAQLAYEVDTSGAEAGADKIQRMGALWGFESVTPFRGSKEELGTVYDTTGVCGIRSNAVLLSFAGTDPAVLQTVITDAHFRINANTNTHRGFQAAFDAPEIVQAATNALASRGGKSLLVSGHSLGAALAILTAHFASKQGAAPVAVYGYGTPRVGGDDFQRDYNNRLGDVTYRMVHGRDLVGCVPTSFMGYRHVGRYLHCEPGAKFRPGDLTAAVSNEPDVSAGYLREILGGGAQGIAAVASGALADLLHGAGSQQKFPELLSTLLQPEGHGPIGKWFKFIPPPIRDHLQDRYIAALTP